MAGGLRICSGVLSRALLTLSVARSCAATSGPNNRQFTTARYLSIEVTLHVGTIERDG